MLTAVTREHIEQKIKVVTDKYKITEEDQAWLSYYYAMLYEVDKGGGILVGEDLVWKSGTAPAEPEK